MKKGTYGTPMNMGGRVQPRNSGFLCIVDERVRDQIRSCLAGVGAGAGAEEHLGDLSGSSDQDRADHHRSDVANALVGEGNLVTGKDHRDGDDDDGQRVEDLLDIRRETAGRIDRRARVLRESKGMIGGAGGAAEKLGLKRTTLNSKLKKLGVTKRDFSSL